MNNTPALKLTFLAVVVCITALATIPARSQTTTSAVTTNTGKMPPTDYSLKRNDDPRMDKRDASMMNDLAKGNLAEIDAGKLALEKAKSEDVKKFAQQMIDDHTRALGEVEALARIKGVVLPDGSGAVAKTKAAALKVTSGNFFDREYAKHAGVGDHEKTLKLLQKIQKDAKDDDFKALAAKMQPTVEHHLMMARELAAMRKKAS